MVDIKYQNSPKIVVRDSDGKYPTGFDKVF